MTTNISKKIYVLDTNVLIHDPTAVLRFQEHDVVLPIVVLEELDAAKVGMSEVARNVREASRILDGLIKHVNGGISQGVQLPSVDNDKKSGRLYFHSQAVKSPLPEGLTRNSSDNALLGITLDLGKIHSDRQVILISKDINLRIKAHALSIRAEDYINDQVSGDPESLYTGMAEPDPTFWGKLGKLHKQEQQDCYIINDSHVRAYYPNQFLYSETPQTFAVMLRRPAEGAVLDVVKDYTQAPQNVWGIHARNREQNFALNLLMDTDIDFVTLLGQAGTGKTLLT
ncbi:MAG: PhoH family protein, partial [Acidiferrobacterales bacterium]